MPIIRSRLNAVFVSLLLLLILLIFPSPALAAEACTASVSPSSVETNSQTTFSFSVTNTGDVAIVYVKVTRPSGNFSLYNVGVPGWTAGVTSSQAEIYGQTVEPGGTFNFNLGGNAGGDEAGSANWTVEIIASGPLVGCSGSLGTAITGVGDVAAPVLSSPTVSGISGSYATVGWTTNEAAESHFSYGLSLDNYDTSLNELNLKTTHSFTITGLSTNTTYYYQFKGVDGSGNSSTYSDFHTFTTSTADILPTPTSSPATVAPTTAPTPTPAIDRAPPIVIIETDFEDPFETAPLINGRVTDNKDIASIEYSTDGEKNWIPVDEIESEGSRKTNFDFIPFLNEDGNYPIKVRAKDKRGNVGTSKEVILVIDRLPPLIGGNLISLGPQPLMPNADGTVIALVGLEQKITLSAVGGPTEIDLFVDDKKISLEYSPETSLWSGFLNLDKVGTYTLTTKAIDGAKNKTTRDLNTVQVVGAGKVINKQTGQALDKAKIKVFTQDVQTKLWNLWDAKAFSQENPQPLDGNGAYQFFLPPGTYYLQIESAGFSTLKSRIFTLNESRPINSDFLLEEGRAIKIWRWKINLPSFLQKTLEIDLSLPKADESQKSSPSLIGQLAPSFSLINGEEQFQLSSLRGETSIISFVSTWSPPALEQISVISQLVEEELAPIAVITTQETKSKVNIFRQRGNYKTPIWVDPDGELIEKYQLTTLPTHFVLDRRGKVAKILTKVLNKEELLSILNSN